MNIRYAWVGKVIHNLIKKGNIRNSTILIIIYLSAKIEDDHIAITVKEISDFLLKKYDKRVAFSTIINTLQTLEDMEILEKIQRGNKIQPTIYKIIN